MCLYVAAGGGGDALAAAIVHRALGHTEPAVIATYAWDRLWIDPVPGPRSPADFTGLRRLGERNYIITRDTEPRPPSSSTLPRLAGDLEDTLVLLDPTSGAIGMRAQLAELAALYQPDHLDVLDVGGDIVARGDEPNLRSPLADALALAATVGLDLPVHVIVTGPGLDGELTEDQVLTVTGTERLGAVDATAVERFRGTFDWHPSEATALLAAAARGIRGRVEIRDAGLPVELTDHSADVYLLDLPDVLSASRAASALVDTASLEDAADETRRECGISEIDYERRKAERSATVSRVTMPSNFGAVVQAVRTEAANRGVDFLTSRRMAEAIGGALGGTAGLRRQLMTSGSREPSWPLWSVDIATTATCHPGGPD